MFIRGLATMQHAMISLATCLGLLTLIQALADSSL